MSSLPILLNLIDEIDPLFHGHDFGLGLHPHHIHRHQHHRQPEPLPSSLVSYALPLSLLNRQMSRRSEKEKEGKIATVGKDGFQVCMDVSQFKPNELNVKVLDNCIVVEGKHEEREDDHGYIARHFVRRYTLPKDYDANKVVSTLSSDGVLTVSAPKPQLEDKSERVIQIQQTGPAHLNVKHNTEEKAVEGNGDGPNK